MGGVLQDSEDVVVRHLWDNSGIVASVNACVNGEFCEWVCVIVLKFEFLKKDLIADAFLRPWQTSTTKKKKRSQSTDVANTGLPPKDGNKRARLEQYNDPSSKPLFIEEIDLLVNRRAAANDNTITSGLDSLLASRQDLVTPANSKDDHDVAVLETDK